MEIANIFFPFLIPGQQEGKGKRNKTMISIKEQGYFWLYSRVMVFTSKVMTSPLADM